MTMSKDIQGPECYGEEFGYNFKYSGKPLRGLKMEEKVSDLYFAKMLLAAI